MLQRIGRYEILETLAGGEWRKWQLSGAALRVETVPYTGTDKKTVRTSPFLWGGPWGFAGIDVNDSYGNGTTYNRGGTINYWAGGVPDGTHNI